MSVFHPESSLIKDVAGLITSTDNVDIIANFILDRTLFYTQSEIMSVFLLDEKGDLVVRAAKGIESDLIPNLRIMAGEDICGRVLHEKTPLLVKDINTDIRVIKKRNGRYKTGSFICCPVMTGENVFGVMNVADKRDGSAFTEKDLELIEAISSLTAIALEHARLISKLHTQSSDLDERNRIIAVCDRSKTEFLAGMSHKLRTPLNSIMGAVYYLKKKGQIDSEESEFINIIFDESQKLNDLIDGIFNFSYIHHEWIRLETRVLNLKDIIRETVASKSIKDTLAHNNISVNIHMPESLPDIVGDKVRLINAFIYIINSIIKYSGAGDKMELTAIHTATSVQIDISVKGRMFSEHDLKEIDSRQFLLLDTEDIVNSAKLHLARNTIELHKGSVLLRNTDKGISVLVDLPRRAHEYRIAMINELADVFISLAAETMDLTRCSLMLSEKLTGDLKITSAVGIPDNVIKTTTLKPGDQIAGAVAIKKKRCSLKTLKKTPCSQKQTKHAIPRNHFSVSR